MSQRLKWQVIYIILFFFTFYLLSFNGIPISDDEQLFAITARNIAVLKHFNAEPLYGDVRLFGQYKAEPFHPFLASLWYIPQKWIFNNGLQSFFILSSVYLSISAGLLLLLLMHFGQSIQIATELVIWGGISTILWPYSKTFFREPLLIMLVLASWLFFEKLFDAKATRKIYLALFVITVLGLVMTKMVYGSVLIAYLLMAIGKREHFRASKKTIIKYAFGGMLLGLVLLFIIQKNDVVFYRFSLTAFKEYWARINTIPPRNFSNLIFLSLFSLWKGFFVYSPICILIIFVPLVRTFESHRKLYLACLPIIVLFSALLFQIITYGNDIWTPPWSVRFLVPSVPLIIIACLPVLDTLFTKLIGRIIIRFLGIGGFVVQLNAIFVNSAFYNRYLLEKSPNFPSIEYWNLATAPAFNQWHLLMENYPANLMIWRVIQNSRFSLVGFLWLLGGFLLLGIFLHLLLQQDKIGMPKGKIYGLIMLETFFLVLFSFLFVNDPFYGELTPLVENVCQKIEATSEKDKIVVIQPYPSALWLTFANRDCLSGNWYSFPEDLMIESTKESLNSVDNFINGNVVYYSKLWLIREDTGNDFFVGKRLIPLYRIQSVEKIDGPISVDVIYYEKR